LCESWRRLAVSLIVAGNLIPPIEVDPNLVTPGVIGFIVTLIVGVGAILLIIDMIKRVRRVRYRAEVGERLDAETKQEGSAP
jgi:capsular polysaccharide biosynthesis protein